MSTTFIVEDDFRDYKDPNSNRPYGIDWTRWMARVGAASITTLTVTVVAPTGDATPIVAGTQVVSGAQTDVWLSGGTIGEWYRIVFHVVADNGATDDRTIHLYVRNL